MMAATQKEQDLKYELVVPVATAEKPTAVASCNYHLDHFGHAFGIRTADGEPAHTRLRRLRPGAHRPGAVPDPRLRPRPLAGERATGAGTMMKTDPPAGPGPLRSGTASTARTASGPRPIATSMCGSSCCTPGASTPSPPCRSPWRSISKATSGRSSSSRSPTCIELYGLDVQELAVWRPLVRHVEEQVARGRPVLVELDSFYLPDTAGTAYQREHVKSTVAVVAIDVADRRLGYFHNQGYYHLEGEDFVNVFRLHEPRDPALLPPYVEFVKRRSGAGPERRRTGLRRRCGYCGATCAACRRRIRSTQFKARLRGRPGLAGRRGAGDVPPVFVRHAAPVRRLLRTGRDLPAVAPGADAARPWTSPIAAFDAAWRRARKTLQFHLARAIARKKPLDLSAAR